MADSKETSLENDSGPGTGEVEALSVKEKVLQLVMNFAMSDDFEKAFEDFAEQHKKSFLKSLVMEEGAEHPLEWYDIYMEYLRTFEGKIERFINKSGFEITDFYEECKLILEDGDVWGETRFFLEALLATSEYQNFVLLMKGEMHRFVSELEVEAPYGTGLVDASSPKDAGRPDMLALSSRMDSKGGDRDRDDDDDSSLRASPKAPPPLGTSSSSSGRMDSKGTVGLDEDVVGSSSPKHMASLDRMDSKGVAIEDKDSK